MSPAGWFKDAVIYQLHVKTFQDSDGDGLGDFRGLLQRLDYFTELGVTCLWLLPFYPSPLRDDGYDIADYLSVHPSYGTVDDFRNFLSEARRRDLRVITELVLNHTSDQNPWFQRARRAPPGSPERDFYVWSDDPRKYREARIIFKDFETSNWAWDPVAKSYFWHRFYSHQPDLNFDNQRVHDALFRVIDFWLEMGVDGVRLDAVPYLYEREGTNCENLPETHAFLRRLRAHIDGKFENRMLLAEANQWPEDAAAYFGAGDECQMNFHFPLMPRMFMALQMEDRFPLIDILDQTPAIPEGCQWAIFLRNHDELTLEMVTDEERDYMYRVYAQDPRARINLGIRRRLAPLLENNRRKIELINSLLFSLPGTPIIYYGDEIGMGDNIYLGDRNGVRTPMQWSPDRNAGFSIANPQRLYLPTIIDPEYHYESVNVENQQRNVSSLFWWMRRLLGVRRRWSAFAHGSIEFLHPENAKVLAFLRRYREEAVLIVANLSRFVQVVELDLSAHAGCVLQELFGQTVFPEIRQTPMVLTLGPHGFYWLALRPAGARAGGELRWVAPELGGEAAWGNQLVQVLEREVLLSYIPTCRWFAGQGRVLREIRIAKDLPFGILEGSQRLLLIEVAFTDGMPERYLLPVGFVDREAGTRVGADAPHAVIARFANGSLLCDALYLPGFRGHLLRAIIDRTTQHQKRLRLIGTSEGNFNADEIERAIASSRVLVADASNTPIAFGESWFLKFFRRFDVGPHPDVEVTRFLSKECGIAQVSPYIGTLTLSDTEGEGVVALLIGFTINQGDGWNYSLDALTRYFDRVLAARVDLDEASVVEQIGGVYPERARQLGQRLAEIHLALLSAEEPELAPEEFSTLYQRSLYQTMRGLAGRVMRRLRGEIPQLPAEARDAAELVVARHGEILEACAPLLHGKIQTHKIRIHGDFHLGQVLNTGKDFSIIDFEGEPRRALGERKLKRSALVDVAGMLRSFDYAASAALRRQNPADHPLLEPWGRAWVNAIGAHFLGSYLATAEGKPQLLPEGPDLIFLLKILLLEKTLHEIAHEMSYRPEFLIIPLRALEKQLSRPEIIHQWVPEPISRTIA